MSSAEPDWKAIPILAYSDSVKDGKAPLFITSIHIEGDEHFVVKCADGSFGRLVQQGLGFRRALVDGVPTNSRKYLDTWLQRVAPQGNCPAKVLEFKRKLVDDRRMREFWDWFERIEYKHSRRVQSSIAITDLFWRATKLPGKPGNMTPKQRAAYFDSVRESARALIELLGGTKFDGGGERELTEDQLEKSLDETLDTWGDDEDEAGHVVAFRVTSYGKYKLSYDYPNCALVESLHELEEWTYWDDQWDGRFYGSSAPIVQTNSRSTPIVYFTCSVHGQFSEYGIELPFPILATLTNVALGLSADDEVDEDTVRRQVRRHQERMAEKAKGHSREGGQSSAESDNSVLFPEF